MEERNGSSPDAATAQWPTQVAVSDEVRFVNWDPAQHPGRVPPSRGSYQPSGLALPKGPVRGSALALIGITFLVVAVFAFQPWNWGSDNNSGIPEGYNINYNDGSNGNSDGNGSGSGDGTGQNLNAPTTYAQPTDESSDDSGDDTGDGSGDSTDPTDDATPADPSDSTAVDPSATPDAVVTTYFDDINERNYLAAWQLGGENLGETYGEFEDGFADTQQDNVTILSVDGDIVTADLAAIQNDDSEKDFTGEYTVTDGVITQFQV